MQTRMQESDETLISGTQKLVTANKRFSVNMRLSTSTEFYILHLCYLGFLPVCMQTSLKLVDIGCKGMGLDTEVFWSSRSHTCSSMHTS